MITIVKGSSVDILATVYSYWTGDASTSVIANLTGSTINAYFKNRPGDSDANAVFTKGGVVTDPTNGICKVTIAAADTNTLSQPKLYYEIVIKMADGTYIRTGVQDIILDPNVGKTLF
jgi:hypothetical protein